MTDEPRGTPLERRFDLARRIAAQWSRGTLNAEQILPALAAILGDPTPGGGGRSRRELLEAIEAEGLEGLAPLRHWLLVSRAADARAAFEHRRKGEPLPEELAFELADLPRDAPPAWAATAADDRRLSIALRILEDRLFIDARRSETPAIAAAVDTAAREACAKAGQAPSIWAALDPRSLVEELRAAASPQAPQPAFDDLAALLDLEDERARTAVAAMLRDSPSEFPTDVDEGAVLRAIAERYRDATAREDRTRLLDWLLSWSTDRAAPFIAALCDEAWSQRRAALVLTLRFGQAFGLDWDRWRSWLAAFVPAEGGRPPQADAAALLCVFAMPRAPVSSRAIAALEGRVHAVTTPVGAESFVRRWERTLTAVERDVLLGIPKAPPPPPPEPEPPSFWRQHVQGFLAENWYLAAGVIMVVAGASLLAYFTWDRHWLLRYTIMPGLLALFTFALTKIASWLEARDASLLGTGATLRGAAIGLLPVNFMAVALLAGDPAVSRKLVVVPAMAALYLLLFGFGLDRWCRQVSSRLGFLGPSLLLLNALVLVPPLARAAAGPPAVLPALVTAFHLGFLVLATAVLRFAGGVRESEAALARRIPWFFGGTIVLTYLEAFAWAHGEVRWAPPAHVYAGLVVLAGALVLYAERRFLELRPEPGRHRAESFLGFAALLLGILMGASHPHVRILTLALAGTVWLFQASYRREALHYWIGLVLLVLSGASFGLLDAFPGPWLPALGIVMALGVGALGALLPRVGDGLLRGTCRELQGAVLTITCVVAVLAQWHFRSWPPGTAAALTVVALIFAWRASRDDSLHAVHLCALVASLALPYLGFVDLDGRTLRGNTMVYGLGLLSWAFIGLVQATRGRLLRQARSTVLFMYGTAALVAMGLRVVFERERVVDPLWYRSYPEYFGPLLAAGALLVATYTSRSLLPAFMASGIVAILLPGLRANVQAAFPGLAFGTGYGSAWTALVLVLVCFRLRGLPGLRNLGEGDRFLGREEFPFRRYDHTLFTWPFVATAIFLILRVTLWTFPQRLGGPAPPVRTAIALLVCGAAATFLAVYLRERKGAAILVHLGWIELFIGLPIAWEGLVDGALWQHELMGLLLVLLGLDVLYGRLVPRHAWLEALLLTRTRRVLRFWTLAFSLLAAALMAWGTPLAEARDLVALVVLLLIHAALVRRRALEGSVVCALGYVTLLAWSAPGNGPLVGRLSIDHGLVATLWAVVAVQLVHLALEGTRPLYDRLAPILIPAQALSTVLAAGIGAVGFALSLSGPALSQPALSLPQHALLTGAVLLTARAHAAGPGALLGLLLGYELVYLDSLRRLPSVVSRIDFLTLPWRLAVLAFALAILGAAGRWIGSWSPRLLAGPYGLARHSGPALPWIQFPAIALAAHAAFRHGLRQEFRADARQLTAPYLGALTQVIAGWSAGWPVAFPLAAILLSVGNVHLVRLFFGARLRAGGLSEVHLVTLGLGLTLVQGSLLRIVARRDAVTAFVNRASLVVGALVLTLLSVTYATHPDIGTMTPLRFAASGLMALAAGLYFRQAARRPARGEESYAELCEGLYHFGLAVALWCGALLVPWFRRPSTALLALGLPALYFYARAELGRGTDVARRYRNSASLLSFVLLGLYALRPVFQMTLFPKTPVFTDHYHDYAPFAMGLGLLMMRLTGLRGTDWLAFYGGLSLMAGSFFGLTALPGLSPFQNAMPAAWCAVGLAHFWTVASAQRSPLRSQLQDLCELTDEPWLGLRAAWGRWVLLASQAAVLLGILDPETDSHFVAPLVLAAASVFVHHAVLYESAWRWVSAGLLVLLALHADFIVPSTLPRDLVVVVVLLVWAAVLLGARRFSLLPRHLAAVSWLLAAISFAHVLYHHPASPTGLWAVAATLFLAAVTPSENKAPTAPEEHLACALVLFAPTWLVFFSQTPLLEEGWAGALHTWPLLATLSTVFLTGLVGHLYAPRWRATPPMPTTPRLFHQVLGTLGRSGPALHTAALVVSITGAMILQVAHYGRPYAARDFGLLLLLYAVLAVAFYQEGARRRESLPYFLAEASLVAGFAVVRSQLLLTTPFWRHEHDVWASLGFSFLLVGAKDAFDRRPPELRRPYVVSLLALPVAALSWTLLHHLGTDLALLVVGLHSLLFATLGRDRRDSPYNLVATAGFVAFVLMVFWTKLELRVLSAYVVPVGLGVLALLQMFGGRLPADTRNRVRLVTLLTMLGSASYYALVDDRHPVAFNVTLLVLCLLAMGLGSLLRIRLYVVLGFAALLLDVASIVVKSLAHMQRGERMTSVGVLVLLLGAGLVGGAAYYKTHRAELDARLDSWRRRFAAWE